MLWKADMEEIWERLIQVVFVLEGRAVYVCGVYVGGCEDLG